MTNFLIDDQLGKFHNWLVNRANAHTVATNYERARGLFEAATKMSQWFAFTPQTTDPLLNIPRDDKYDLHWTQEQSYRSSCTYYLLDDEGVVFGTIVGHASSPNREAQLRFLTEYRSDNVLISIGVFSSLDGATRAIKAALHPVDIEPLPNPPSTPLWIRDKRLSQLFSVEGTCIGMIAERRLYDGEAVFMVWVCTADDKWVQMGYLRDREDAERLVVAKLEQHLKTRS